ELEDPIFSERRSRISPSLSRPSYSDSWGPVERDHLLAATLPGVIERGGPILAGSHGWLILLLFPVKRGQTERFAGRLGPELSTSKRHNGCSNQRSMNNDRRSQFSGTCEVENFTGRVGCGSHRGAGFGELLAERG